MKQVVLDEEAQVVEAENHHQIKKTQTTQTATVKRIQSQ